MIRTRVMLLLLLAVGASAQALQTELPLENPPVSIQPQWTKISGRVVAVAPDAHTLQLTDRRGNRILVTIDKNVQILRYYRVVDLEALKLQDRVEVRYIGPL